MSTLLAALLAAAGLLAALPSKDPSSTDASGSSDAEARVAGVAGQPEVRRARTFPDATRDLASPVGMNLAGVTYWSTQLAFEDLFRHASRWIPQEAEGWTWDTGAAIATDERGWVERLSPGQAAGILLARDTDGHYPGGEWTVTWSGKGRLEAHLDARITSQAKGRMTLAVTPGSSGVHLKLVATDPRDPLRDIRVRTEADQRESTFREVFLAHLEPFSVVRFMQWQRTNDSELREWSERARPDDARQSTSRGVAVELCVELANEARVEPWFCMPHQASDDFVRQFARVVKEQLDPNLRVWIEYSNEVWNETFAQARWARERGLEQELSRDAYQAQLRFYSQRATRVIEIWREEFGERSDRVVGVLAGHNENPWTAETILDWGDAANAADVWAVAPYFGHGAGAPSRTRSVLAGGLDSLFADLREDAASAMEKAEEHARIAKRHGLALVAYEGGQHLVGQGLAVDDESLTRLFHLANADARMGELYSESLQSWKDAGGTMFLHWCSVERWTKWGSWGIKPYMDTKREHAPKWDALLTFSEETKPWW